MHHVIKKDKVLREVIWALDRMLPREITDEILRWVLGIPDYVKNFDTTWIKRTKCSGNPNPEIVRGDYSYEFRTCYKCGVGSYKYIWHYQKKGKDGVTFIKLVSKYIEKCCNGEFYGTDEERKVFSEALGAFWKGV